ncbi:MAG: imidazole glycerol phosphate synthase subunit HisH [Bacillota bacterium]
MSVTIIDYGMGNIMSVYNAFNKMNCKVNIIKNPDALKKADKIILPGVGSFNKAMNKLEDGGWIKPLNKAVQLDKKKFLGICLGMQLLATKGYENGITKGLNWINGEVKRLKSSNDNFRLPHVGWNNVEIKKRNGLYKGLKNNLDFYFINSYAFFPSNDKVVSGICDYKGQFVSSIELDNIFATQFHPEKSQKAGFQILRNFLQT